MPRAHPQPDQLCPVAYCESRVSLDGSGRHGRLHRSGLDRHRAHPQLLQGREEGTDVRDRLPRIRTDAGHGTSDRAKSLVSGRSHRRQPEPQLERLQEELRVHGHCLAPMARGPSIRGDALAKPHLSGQLSECRPGRQIRHARGHPGGVCHPNPHCHQRAERHEPARHRTLQRLAGHRRGRVGHDDVPAGRA